MMTENVIEAKKVSLKSVPYLVVKYHLAKRHFFVEMTLSQGCVNIWLTWYFVCIDNSQHNN